MQMIPAVPHRTGSKAELRVFDALRRAFAGDSVADEELVAYHSLNLTRHDYKRFGEIDFLIVGRVGIMVLEVKGGGVSCHDGLWSYQRRVGRVSRSPEGPFRQAQSALHGLMDRLGQQFPASRLARFVIGYGVVFPDCNWPVNGAEWDQELLADARACRNLERWLAQLFDYWRQRDRRRQASPDAADVARLKGLLRPDVELAVPLYRQLEPVTERAAALTEDQMAMVDIVDANRRVMACGGAGTGKTFVAMELARRWTDLGLKVLLACRSPWLKGYLQARFGIPGLAVSVVDAVAVTARRHHVTRFDALIVDEGQDLLEMTFIDRLDAILDGGLERGRWCFFHDLNNQACLIGEPQPQAMQRLLACAPARLPLTINCRNTRQILTQVQSTLGADMGVRGTGEGPAVVELHAASAQQSAIMLAQEITRIVEHGGLMPSDLTLLSAWPFEQSSAALLPAGFRSAVVVLDEYSLRHYPPAGIGFATIASFKGIESEAVIVIDLPAPGLQSQGLHRHYVGLSRARSVLSIIYQSPACASA